VVDNPGEASGIAGDKRASAVGDTLVVDNIVAASGRGMVGRAASVVDTAAAGRQPVVAASPAHKLAGLEAAVLQTGFGCLHHRHLGWEARRGQVLYLSLQR